MTGRPHVLTPFQPLDPPLPLSLRGCLTRDGRTLTLRYLLQGPLAALRLPAPAASPGRRPGLWQSTCFEVFFAPATGSHYWEINLSPAGHWNIYRFTGYRQGMAEESAAAALPAALTATPAALSLTLTLPPFLPLAQPVVLGLSAVLHLTAGPLTYWALTHQGPQPDFHRRDSWLITLPG